MFSMVYMLGISNSSKCLACFFNTFKIKCWAGFRTWIYKLYIYSKLELNEWKEGRESSRGKENEVVKYAVGLWEQE